MWSLKISEAICMRVCQIERNNMKEAIVLEPPAKIEIKIHSLSNNDHKNAKASFWNWGLSYISQLILLLSFENYYLEALPFYTQVHRDHMQCFSIPWNSKAALENEQNNEWMCKSR